MRYQVTSEPNAASIDPSRIGFQLALAARLGPLS